MPFALFHWIPIPTAQALFTLTPASLSKSLESSRIVVKFSTQFYPCGIEYRLARRTMTPHLRHMDAIVLTVEDFHRERAPTNHHKWDLEDPESNNEGPFAPYIPTKENLDAWLAHWRNVYQRKML